MGTKVSKENILSIFSLENHHQFIWIRKGSNTYAAFVNKVKNFQVSYKVKHSLKSVTNMTITSSRRCQLHGAS
jgi:hypothetical protein